MDLPRAVTWQDGRLKLLDQTLLPLEEKLIDCDTIESVYAAIQALQVRGAPAIGIAAAYGLTVGLSQTVSLEELGRRAEYLISARPTAVNLAWALQRLVAVAKSEATKSLISTERLIQEAKAIHEEDRRSCRAIGDHGLELIRDKSNLLTHCNAGSLAVSEYGTALAPIYRGKETGLSQHVYVDETRPLLQGARLTSFELSRHGVDHTLITDNMAAHVMSQGKVDAVIVGTDRVARNGDAANKIGTFNLAILCQYFQIPFYVASPASTIDVDTASGHAIEIETRSSEEVRAFAGVATSLPDTPVYNPAFDVTPAGLITAIITERGVVHEPNEAKIVELMANS